MDGENLTVPANSFDTVISRVGLIFFPDQQKALKEMPIMICILLMGLP